MKKLFASIIISLGLLSHVFPIQAKEIAALPLYSQIYDDKRDPFKDAVAAINLAKATHRNVLIEIGGNWCTWCHKMDSFLADNQDIYKILHQNFVLLKTSFLLIISVPLSPMIFE